MIVKKSFVTQLKTVSLSQIFTNTKMASSSSLLSEEQLLCPICLAVFNQPVSTPCGHNYCMSCLSSYWDTSSVFFCPVCKETFSQRPDLRVNTFISGLAEQFMTLQLSQDQTISKVLCDICTETQRDAVKSCLNCLTSYCEAHLEPHHRVSGLKRHTLVEPVSSPDRVCSEHNQLLTLFCTNEGVLLCKVCARSKHPNHKTVHLQQAYRDLRAELGGTEVRVHTMIQEKLQKVTSIKESVKQRQDETQQVIANSVQNLTELVSKVQKSHSELVKKMEVKQQEVDSEAQAVIEQIEQEVKSLRETKDKLNELKNTEDSFIFLQNYPNEAMIPESSAFSVSLRSDVGLHKMRATLNSCTSQLQMFLEKMNKEINMFSDDDVDVSAALRHVQQYAVDFVLDPQTAHPWLILSRDLKEVRFNTDSRAYLHVTTKTFTVHMAVLAASGFSSSRFYFEVFVGKKTEWVIGVAAASVPRKTEIFQRPGCGLWGLYFRVNKFCAYSCLNVPVHEGKVERVGVFVDYNGGQVSFYDVKTATLIHSINHCVFTETLYPIFNPCDDEFPSNLDPMVIVPVSHK